MSVVLGVNAVLHDPAAALFVDGRLVAAAEEERFDRRKHGKLECFGSGPIDLLVLAPFVVRRRGLA